jgi:hypothetical protein
MGKVALIAAEQAPASQGAIRFRPAAVLTMATVAAVALLAWWQVGIPAWARAGTSRSLGQLEARLDGLVQLLVGAALALRAALLGVGAWLSQWLPLSDAGSEGAWFGQSGALAVVTACVAVVCVGLVREFRNRFAKEMDR